MTRGRHMPFESLDTWAGQIEGSVVGTAGDDDTLVELGMLLVCPKESQRHLVHTSIWH